MGSSPAMAVPKRDSVRLVGDLLSRWVGVSALPVRAVAVCSPCDQDDSMPSKAVVRQAQQKALATDGTEVQSYESAVGLAVLDDEGLFRIHARGRRVLWILDPDKHLQVRLMICAHMRDAENRGVAATLLRLQEFCVWSGMKPQMREFVRQCLHCADTRSEDVVPRPLGETVHGTAPNEVVHFDYFCMWARVARKLLKVCPRMVVFGTCWLSCVILATSCRWSLLWFVPPKQLLSLC